MAKKLRFLFTLLFIMAATLSWGEDVSDVLNYTKVGVTGTSYKDWIQKSFSSYSSAIYSGNSAGGNSSIQLRSDGNNSGIVSTTSGGRIKYVSIKWNNSTADARVVNIYGSNTAYTSPQDLYGSNAGTLIGSAKKSDGNATITINGDFTYIGIRSNSGAMYLSEITIVWETVTVAAPTFTPAGGAYTSEQEVAISTTTEDATIYYTTDGSTPTDASTEYSGPFTISETTIIKAIAVKDNTISNVTEATYTIIPAGAETATLWSEDFSSYSAGDVPSGGTFNYSCTNGGGTTKIYNENTAGRTSPELLVAKNNGTFTAVIPLKNVFGDLTLTYYTNAQSLEVSTTTEGLSGGATYNTKEKHVITFTGITKDTKSITIVFKATSSNNVRLDDIVLTGLQMQSVKTPVISLAEGTYFGPQSVEISCETEGATIYYTLDGTDPTTNSTVYTDALSISETKTLKAIAVKDGETSAVASATYTFPTVYKTIAAFKEANTTGYLDLTGAQVVFIDSDKKNIYVRDDSGAIDLYNKDGFTTELTAGDILSGIIKGTYTLYKNLPEITDIEDVTKLTSSSNESVVAKEIEGTVSAIAANVCDLVKITKTTITQDGSNYYVGENVQLYDKFSANYSIETGVSADVIGIATIFNEAYEISPRTSADVVYYPVAPTFSLAAGSFDEVQTVTITAAEGTEIHYTIDGSNPTVESAKYENAITINEGTTILKAVAVRDGLVSDVTSAEYTVTIPKAAQVGDVTYRTFAEAVAALTETNNVITLLANVEEPYTLAEGQVLNVKLNGFNLTVNAPAGYLVKTEEKNGVTTYSTIAPVAQIGDVKYETIAAAVAAAEEGQTVEVIKAGEYTLPGIAKNITIEGAEEIEVLFTHTTAGNVASIPNGATFKNVKFEFGNVTYHGFQHAGTINMEGCTLSGKLFSYGDMNFNDCQFVQTNSDYHMWTYSGNVTYTGCTFTNSATGKFVNVYNESGATKYTVTFEGCKFVNQSNAANKAAINVKATSGSNLLAYDVIINNCTTEGAFPEASSSDVLVVLNSVVQVDDRTASGVDNITVTQDGVLIYPATVAAIGETRYPTLQSAVDAAQQMGGEVTINIIDNISEETVTIQEVANFKLTIDGKKDENSNYTVDAVIVVDGLRGNGGSSTNGASVTLQNIAFVKTTSTDGIQASHYPHHLTIQDCTYSGSDNDKWFLNASVDGPLYGVTVKNVTVEHARLIYANMAEDAVFQNITATNDVKVGFNVKTSGTALIENCQVTTGKYAFRDYSDGYEGTFTLKDNTFVSTSEESDEGVIVNRGGAVGTAHINVVSGTYTGHVKVMNNKEGVLAISGGYFSEEFPQEYIAADLVAQEKICVPAADMEGYFTIGDPTFVAQIGDVKYTSFAKAIAAVPADGAETTITMIADETINSNEGVTIPSSKNVILDLNGKTITGVVQSPSNAQVILNKGTLVVTDGSDEKKGTITNEVSDENAGSPMDKNWYSDVITNNGTLTISAGNIVNTGTGGACYAIDNITNGTLCSPVLNIAGGNISAQKVAVRMFCNSTTNDNIVNMTGGNVSSVNAYGIQTQQANIKANKATLSITGGTISGQYAWCDYGDKNTPTQFDNSSYSITGGFFSGDIWSYATYYCGMEGFISGGYFSNVVGGDLVVPGSACVANTDDATKENYPHTIGLADIYYYWLDNNGNIDGGGYYLIYAPFAGPDPVLMDGEFIVLQRDVTLTQDIEYIEEVSFGDPIFKGGTFTLRFGEYNIDLNGHKFPLPTGVTVKTDKQTNIFSAMEAGYIIQETVTEEGFEYTAIEKPIIVPTAPVVFHDSGEYEAGLSVPMYAQAGAKIYYTTDGSEPTAASTEYTGALTINSETTVKAIAVLDGVASAVVTKVYTIKEAAAETEAIDGYYSIKNNGNEKYINVAGRKTVTFVADGDEVDDAGTVLKVKINTKGQVEELRSQGIDLPGYAERAMNYVPKFVKIVVDKLHAEGSGEILGKNGLDAIMDKFNESFDYHLYVEQAGDGYRIYGKTPSMKPVVDFYAENKENVDYKLPQLEAFINSAIDKVLQKTGGRGASILTEFKLHDIWQKMGETLTEPTDEASTAKFYEEVLASESNVWNFAYQTAMIYWNNVKNHPRYEELKGKLGDYAKYVEKVENIQPDFKYYIVGKDNGVDFISEGNTDIAGNAPSTIWTMNKRENYAVTFDKKNSLNLGRELYTTLYVDFAYTLPETVKAYKVTAIDEKTGLATKEEITGVIPAQTPVLLQMIVDPETVTDADLTQTLTLSTEAGTAVTGNLLVGPDYLINEYEIKTAQVVSLFDMAKELLGENAYNSYLKEYEHLMMKNAGTVNNKYFFGISADDDKDNQIYAEGTTLRTLFKGDKKLGFYQPQDIVKANTAFVISDKNPVRLSLIGDVNRDGNVDITDVTCQIDIVLGKDKPEDNYDYDAADLDFNEEVTISDVTDLIDVVLGKKIIE